MINQGKEYKLVIFNNVKYDYEGSCINCAFFSNMKFDCNKMYNNGNCTKTGKGKDRKRYCYWVEVINDVPKPIKS